MEEMSSMMSIVEGKWNGITDGWRSSDTSLLRKTKVYIWWWRSIFNVVVSWQNLTSTTLGMRSFHHTVQLEDSRYLICHHPVSRMPCLSPSSKFSTNSMPFLSTSFKFSTKAVSWVQFLEAILLVNLLEHGLLFQACLNQSSCLWKEVEQFKGASNAYVYIYIYHRKPFKQLEE